MWLFWLFTTDVCEKLCQISLNPRHGQVHCKKKKKKKKITVKYGHPICPPTTVKSTLNLL